MYNIIISGANGFVGNYFIKHNSLKYNFCKINLRTTPPVFNKNVNLVLHFAGKAHDLKNATNSNEYYIANTDLTISVFDKFIESNASVFITLSSVKAVADSLEIVLSEDHTPNPFTDYGKSKLLAEEYILSKQIPKGKRVFILRPCMIHGPGNKGNLNLLYKIVRKCLPWPLGAFDNKRSFCSIDNLNFVLNELIQNDQIPSGIYNVADDEALSTNELIKMIAESQGKKPFILNIPRFLVKFLSKLGDVFRLPLNTERLNKLTETYIVSNKKLKNFINKPLPVTAKDGLIKTFNSFNNA